MNVLRPSLPRRIVCLTEETTEALYALGAGDLVVGISGFTMRPPEARKTKPKVSTYLDAKTDEIAALSPDVVLCWSDLQAPIAAELIRAGIEVICFNQRSIEGILSMILRLGALVGKGDAAEQYVHRLMQGLEHAAARGAARSIRPRIYLEEWFDPLIGGIRWVSEVVEICGGDDVFSEFRAFDDAKRRIIANPEEPLRRNPDAMIASWCGKMFKPEKVRARSSEWAEAPFVSEGRMFEIPSVILLQPGPAVLTDGLMAVMSVLDTVEQQLRHDR